MRTTEIVLLTFVAVGAIGLYNLSVNMEPKEHTMFNVWMEKYGKEYADLGEKSYRLGIWLNNFKFVAEHNARFQAGEETYELEMNGFADLTSEEFGAKYLMKPNFGENVQKTSACNGSQAPTNNLPDEVDWSAKGKSFIISRWCYPHQESGTVRIMLGLLSHRFHGRSSLQCC